ncbi:MAG TPA: radical SAM protein [Candidatus Gastranaerophilales bacterium]|nr:radical SAM protein [Candidatus Gastranaerophilales bacterium]
MRVLPQKIMWKPRSGYLDMLKKKGQEFIFGQILDLIGVSSKNNLITLTKIFEKIAGSEGGIRHARRMRWLFETEHAHLGWWQKIINELNPNCRNKFILNFFVHGYYGDNLAKRAKFNEKNKFFPPTVLLSSITQKCNYNCAGCWAHNYEIKEDLSFDQWRKVFDEAVNEMGIHMMAIVGGEPFIRKDFLDLVELYPDCIFLTFTNGSLLTDETVQRIKKLGNVAPMLSLNGLEEANDKVRGKGSYKTIMEKMDLLKKEGIFFGVSVTATRENAEEVVSNEFMKMLSDKGSLWTWVFHYVPVGENPDPTLMPTAEQRDMIKQAVYNARNTLPMMSVDFWGDGPEMMGCIAGGRQYIHVNSLGDVEPCAFVHLATHNIKNSSLTEALASPFMSSIRNAIPYDGNMLRPCMIVDRPKVLRAYYQRFKPYQTHRGAADYLTKPEIIEQIDKYSEEVKELMDKNWAMDYYMTMFPLPGEYYHDRIKLCSSEIPVGGIHGGCEKAGGCKCDKDLSALEKISEELMEEKGFIHAKK